MECSFTKVTFPLHTDTVLCSLAVEAVIRLEETQHPREEGEV